MSERRVIIIGGGIGGLALGLTLHQIGVRCSIYESVRSLKPLGVGINLQPNAVRELYELGIGPETLDKVGLPVKEWALVGICLLYTSPSPRDLSTSRMPSSA